MIELSFSLSVMCFWTNFHPWFIHSFIQSGLCFFDESLFDVSCRFMLFMHLAGNKDPVLEWMWRRPALYAHSAVLILSVYMLCCSVSLVSSSHSLWWCVTVVDARKRPDMGQVLSLSCITKRMHLTPQNLFTPHKPPPTFNLKSTILVPRVRQSGPGSMMGGMNGRSRISQKNAVLGAIKLPVCMNEWMMLEYIAHCPY